MPSPLVVDAPLTILCSSITQCTKRAGTLTTKLSFTYIPETSSSLLFAALPSSYGTRQTHAPSSAAFPPDPTVAYEGGRVQYLTL